MTKKIVKTLTDLLDDYQRSLKEPMRLADREKYKDIIEGLIYSLRVINAREKEKEKQSKIFNQ